ncbi:GntR family transcriptional regulator [Rahnella bonaserana]|jgi:GntR family transcriptional regulator, rspAB operon transcriptional repressor|uniref:GntR family transcriptional regulator n=1 Tax=Rahnella bonaserana TaxID=2816248 RepID=A0ABS6LYT8_9GAMM|nr:GntR family transcriptional regulator [Rahnella bonaserana]MBU9857238.1 GntR family transcriptional regulator [Rahnella bonaserana]MCL9642445.1 GntR family transcriptional regulator [Rahnella victoriana]WHZ41729.1 GntR family transcriptional regulator [Rahnella bonaserana]
MTDSFEFLSNVPVNQQIYRTLRQDIVTCAIAPGAFLSEKEISTRFNVSRQPVREAFIKLAEAGLVQVLPQRGTYVMKISSKRVADGRFIREAVETAVVRRAAMVATDKDLALLGHNLERQTLAAKSLQTQEFLLLDDEFHRTIAQIIDCKLAWETVEHIKATMDRVRFLTLSKVSPPESLIAQHYAIFEGLKARDPDAAEKAIRIHLQEMISTITPIAEQNSDWFDAE